MDPTGESRSEIAFFDLETTRPTPSGQGYAILEFGAILVCPRKLVELDYYSTLIRPTNISLINSLSVRCNGITPDAVSSAPTFSEIADTVFDILHGRIWAGYNILSFDCVRLREAFAELGRAPPEPKGTIDTYPLLTQRFGRRAGDMKMASLATYFGLGNQTHRSLDDVRMNLEVVKNCAAVLFLESSLPDIFTEKTLSEGSSSVCSVFFDPEELCCAVKVRFGVNRETSRTDSLGRPKLNFVANASPSLCHVLDACDAAAQKLSVESGSTSQWKPMVIRIEGYANFPTVRLHIPTLYADSPRYETEIYKIGSSGALEKLVFSQSDEASEIEAVITTGIWLDAYISLDYYDYQQNAGIRLVAKNLVIN